MNNRILVLDGFFVALPIGKGRSLELIVQRARLMAAAASVTDRRLSFTTVWRVESVDCRGMVNPRRQVEVKNAGGDPERTAA